MVRSRRDPRTSAPSRWKPDYGANLFLVQKEAEIRLLDYFAVGSILGSPDAITTALNSGGWPPIAPARGQVQGERRTCRPRKSKAIRWNNSQKKPGPRPARNQPPPKNPPRPFQPLRRRRPLHPRRPLAGTAGAARKLSRSRSFWFWSREWFFIISATSPLTSPRTTRSSRGG